MTARGGWRELLSREHAFKLLVMVLALWMHASNSMLTATTMPSAVAEIGGLEFLSWTFALYFAGSICAAASTALLVARHGLRRSMAGAALLYAGGCVIVAAAGWMPVLLCGRLLQGLGGGALIALVYVGQDRFFPARLVPRVVALLSAVWMLAAFAGPLIGGAFANAGLWRLTFWCYAAQALLLVPAAQTLLRGERAAPAPGDTRLPLVRLLLLFAAILLVSLSAAYYHPHGSPLMVALGCALLGLLVWRDRHAGAARMLPAPATVIEHALGNGILATLLLAMSIMSFVVYGPYVLIQLYGLNPLEAGFVVLVESLAWGAAAILFSGFGESREPPLIRLGAACVVAGLVGAALAFPRQSLAALIAAIAVMNGGMGMIWGYVIKRVLASVAAADKARTAALLPITQQTGFALGAALTGLIANGLGIDRQPDGETLRAVAFWMFAGFVPLALLGNAFGWRFVSPRRRHG